MKSKFFLLLIFLSSACVNNTQVTKPNDIKQSSQSPNTIITPYESISSSPQNVPSPDISLTPQPNSSLPVYTTPEYEKFVTVTGIIYDNNLNRLENAEVTIIPIDPLPSNVSSWKGDTFVTLSNGLYIFRSIPSETRIQITVKKNGYTEKVRMTPKLDTLYSNTEFNFGGNNESDKVYALEKIN